jgi:hypothetical protein
MVVCAVMSGSRLEKAAVVAAVIAWIASLLFADRSNNWTHPQLGLFLVDSTFLGVLIFIGINSNKIWPLVACGFQLCSVALHVANFIHPERRSAYLAALQLPSSAVVAAIFWGVAGKQLQALRA